MGKLMQKGFYLDLTRCTSCYACVVACKAHHANLEETIYWRRVIVLETGIFPDTRVFSLSLSCVHCGTPACRVVCPTRAIYKRMEDGLVIVNPDLCIGCKMCLLACPFGIPQFGRSGKMQKCDFCLDRLERRENPVCTSVCPARALHHGTLDELSSLAIQKSVRRLIRSTDPSFFI
jgi:anaerobic dimethyl sulfoxide reductase subunit B (iron-sulfur subunit)